MSAYLICMVRVDDPETYRRYTAETPSIIARYGGRFLVRGGAVDNVEGPPFKNRLVVLEFPSKDTVRRFYDSEDYQRVIKYRHASSESTFLLADGVRAGSTVPDDQVVKSG